MEQPRKNVMAEVRPALALVAGVVVIAVALLAGFGLEARGVKFAGAALHPAE